MAASSRNESFAAHHEPARRGPRPRGATYRVPGGRHDCGDDTCDTRHSRLLGAVVLTTTAPRRVQRRVAAERTTQGARAASDDDRARGGPPPPRPPATLASPADAVRHAAGRGERTARPEHVRRRGRLRHRLGVGTRRPTLLRRARRARSRSPPAARSRRSPPSRPSRRTATALYSERGLLGLALSPNFATDHFVYAFYSRNDFTTQVVVRFTDCAGVASATRRRSSRCRRATTAATRAAGWRSAPTASST